jgi:HEXXH motif-containing protein
VDASIFAVASAMIEEVPNLAAIVYTRVRSVHLLKSEPGYDVSHSEPQWADRVFVSVPERRDKVGALRLAEEIVHEALHLHLTELEAIAPLVADLTGTLQSPWRPELRSYGGVLHGAFVFACLKRYFDVLPEHWDSSAGRHIRRRRAEISQELSEIDVARMRAALTERGAALLSRLLGCPAMVGSEA